ncbi:MAG: uncharacterized protein A8A55_0601 [Amphiamblys sp. WSBS2006]|nr:MAG: uncharacterized protein A8A55_0601 [Amphiamblys sp. WSBS2006]
MESDNRLGEFIRTIQDDILGLGAYKKRMEEIKKRFDGILTKKEEETKKEVSRLEERKQRIESKITGIVFI